MPTTPPHTSPFYPLTFKLLTFLLPFLLLSCSPDTSQNQTTAQNLYILSPHGSDIRREFADAFSAWHLQHYGTPVNIQWVDIGAGGTGTVAQYLARRFQSSDTADVDLTFGGGSAQFSQYAAAGFLVPPPPLDPADKTFTQDPIDQIPKDLFGQPLHHPQNLWVAATMSSFGMVINKDRLAELHLPTPRTWEDLASPDFLGRLSLADPSKSGSVRTSYEQIFQQYGFEKGWAILTQLFANATVIRDGGSNPAEDVGSAEAVAGIVIDFFGRIHITRAGPAIVGFIIPEGGSALDADPIGMLKGQPSPILAARFIRFTVSPEGQRLWTFKPGVAAVGRPKKTALGRLSVLPSLYDTESQNMLDPANPFHPPGNTKPLLTDAKAQFTRNKFIGDLLKSTLIDNQPLLAQTRRAIHADGDPPALLAQLNAPPTFTPATIAPDGTLTFAAPQPLTTATQQQLADDYAPPAGSPKAAHLEQLQTHLRNHWRQSDQTRLNSLLQQTQPSK